MTFKAGGFVKANSPILNKSNFFKRFLAPKSKDEEIMRKELILNLIIAFSLVCFTLINLIRIIDIISNPNDRGLPLIYTLAILGFFILLVFLSRRSLIKTASWLIIGTYAFPAAYSFIVWGADLPAALLLSVLVITFFGLLFSAKSAIFGALVLNIFLFILTYAQARGWAAVKNYWRAESHELGDAIIYAILLILITSLIFVFDREIRRALTRAKNSEAALQKEKDGLELRVEERTKLIREMEAGKINQLYRLAEFGRLSSGIFHDLINPLTAVSLNLEQAKLSNASDKTPSSQKLGDARDCLSQAISAAKKMEDLIACIKRSIKQESVNSLFSLSEEISSAIKLLSYKLRQAKIEIFFNPEEDIFCQGDAVKFSQIVSNLICNSIDACVESQDNAPLLDKLDRRVIINLFRKNNQAILEIRDNGNGVSPENATKIFQPFFTTKKAGGLGLGLSSTKNIVENSFGGCINFNSQPGTETIFTITLPLTYAA